MPTVRDVVSPAAFTAFQIFGYLVFAAALTLILLAVFEASLRMARKVELFRRRKREQTLKFAPTRARVLAFPQRKTRNRLVIQ